MTRIETHVRYRIQQDKLPEFKALADGLVATARYAGDQLLRCDWFVNEVHNEAVAMTVYQDEAALRAYLEQVREPYRTLATLCSDIQFEVFGKIGEASYRVLPVENVVTLHFANGLSTTLNPAEGIPPIEIYTRFDIHPGKLELFKHHGAELLRIVDAEDPGTLRYDWFYDDEKLRCVVMDTYADAQGMFSHMRNAHAAHEKLLDHALMTTEFLGELPDDVFAAVEKYNPFIVRLYAGMNTP